MRRTLGCGLLAFEGTAQSIEQHTKQNFLHRIFGDYTVAYFQHPAVAYDI